MDRMPQKNKPSRCNAGFSLVEMLVSATILAIAIVAVVAVVRKSQELTAIDTHRRGARAIIAAQFEGPTYSYKNYASLTDDSLNTTVVVDPRGSGTTDDLSGRLSIKIGAVQNLAGSNGVSVPYRQISMKVKWPEPDSTQYDSVVISKCLTQIQ